jgi:hypothetical protein
MTLTEAVQLVIGHSGYAMSTALKALQALQVGSPIAEQRVRMAIVAGLQDPEATFSDEEKLALGGILAGISPEGTRTVDLRIRLTPEEKALVERDAKAADLTVSAYVRSRLGLGE